MHVCVGLYIDVNCSFSSQAIRSSSFSLTLYGKRPMETDITPEAPDTEGGLSTGEKIGISLGILTLIFGGGLIWRLPKIIKYIRSCRQHSNRGDTSDGQSYEPVETGTNQDTAESIPNVTELDKSQSRPAEINMTDRGENAALAGSGASAVTGRGDNVTSACSDVQVQETALTERPRETADSIPTVTELDESQSHPAEINEDSTDAVPFNRPTAMALPEDGARYGAEGNTVKQAMNLEEEKNLILFETAELVAGSCDLRQMALRLLITESAVARIEHDNPKLISQFYQVFQLLSKKVPNSEEMFEKLLTTMVKTNQESTAIWLRKRLGMREPEASLEGEASSPISYVIPQTEETGGNNDDEFYDIFLMHTGRSDFTKTFQSICKCHNWHVKTSDTIPATAPVHEAIERILYTSTHLALIITESDCTNYRDKKLEMCMTVEMALQLAYADGTLAGKVLPIRCCQKRSLPLVLQALTGAHIDEESFEERLVATIDTKTRLSRMREKQN